MNNVICSYTVVLLHYEAYLPSNLGFEVVIFEHRCSKGGMFNPE